MVAERVYILGLEGKTAVLDNREKAVVNPLLSRQYVVCT